MISENSERLFMYIRKNPSEFLQIFRKNPSDNRLWYIED